jgi:ABC-type sugar transport system ATPase subunit
MSESANTVLQLREIVKEFPGVRALDGVNFDVRRGEVHALCGENGAGKSTLMKIISGLYPAGSYTGDLLVDGKRRQFASIKDSQAAGVAIVYQ